MNIDNKEKAASIKLIYLLIPFIIIIGTALFFLLSEHTNYIYITIPVVLLIIYFLIMAVLKYQYVAFYAGPDKLEIRYKSLSPFKSPNKSIQIKSIDLQQVEFKKAKIGKAKSLILYLNSPSGLAKYPPVSLSLLSKTDVEKIEKSLQLILAMNQAKNR